MIPFSSGRRRMTVVAGLVLVACGSPLEVEANTAVASLGCAPDDGPATTITLSLDDGGQGSALTIAVFGPRAELRPGRWSIDGRGASASWCADGSCAPAGPGALRLRRVDPDRIDGSVDVRVPGGRVVWGFAAGWVGDPVLCG
ncbi:MAG: hypothetical protein R2882_01075 [Gemmatimonadales bacterium]